MIVLVPRLKRTVFRSKDSQELVGSVGLFVSCNGIIIDVFLPTVDWKNGKVVVGDSSNRTTSRWKKERLHITCWER
jgi:hypothetical protein